MAPYFISDTAEGCDGWATVKDDGEVMGCHTTKQDAIDQGLAIAQAEDSTFEGEWSVRAEPGELVLGDFVEWDSSGGMARGRIEHIMTEGTLGIPDSSFSIEATPDDPAALIRIYRPDESDTGEVYWDETDVLVGHKFSTLTKIDPLPGEPEDDGDDDVDGLRQVDLSAPAYMRASARRGLEWHREGLSGDGVVDRTIREAEAMSRGIITADKWVRLRAWISRHLVDMDAPANTPGDENYPGPGAVAMALWGGGGSKRSAERALAYADGVVGRIEAENEGRAKGEALSKMETRLFQVENFEVREDADGMHLEGYAALFNSRSENLGGFTETIQPGAFRKTLDSRNNVFLLYNHDTSAVLASRRAGTLTLVEDERGLKISASIAPTSTGRDVAVLVKRGDLSGFSFGFSMPARGGDSWNSEGTERVLHHVRLHEVSLTPMPAYQGTNGTATMRGLDKIAQRANVDADALADALLKIENGEDISLDDRTLLQTVINELAPEAEAPVADNSLELLALKKKKLQVLMGY
jgi:HK97 family phage prohead protease